MFGILIQLTTFFYAIPLAEMSHSEDNMTDDLYRTYGIYEIPWENMRFFSESILLLDRSRLTINFHKLFVNLVTTYFVYKLEIKQMAISYGWTARNPEAIFKKVLSENVVPCPLGRSSSEFKEFLCMGLTRKLVILNKPSDTILEIYGREVLIENFAGCFVPKTSLVPITVMTVLYEYEVDQTDSARECAVKCREISNYFGLDSEETCVCVKRMSEFMSVNSTFCGNCSNPLYICGGHKNLAVYTTNNTRTENLLNPPYVECVEDSTFCGTCLTGKKGYNCEFVDCSSDNGGCSRKCSSVTMMDEEFGFCTCPDGYVGEDSSCEDYNECNENVCAENQTCVNTLGSFTCACHLGFLKDATGQCSDEDECESLETSCPEDQSCINIPGSFRCDCNLGYKKDELLNCIDVDECLFASTCGEGGHICTNTDGSYTCRCVSGYIIDESGKCLDEDECKSLETSCPEDQSCINIPGSFRCDCNLGYKRDELLNCIDVDECLFASTCDEDEQICTNTVGSYTCRCVLGYIIDESGTCLDIDECGDHQTCDTTSTECVNIPSSFVCSCLRGYHKMDWFRCADVNECETPAISCPEGVPCINLPGSFDCLCPEGSSKSEYGHTTLCDDVDECEVPDLCDATSSFCLNTRPLYVCLCRKGFASVDNFTCVPFSDDANDTNDTTTMLTTGYPSEEHDGLDAFNISLAVLILSIVTVIFILVYFFGKQSRHVSPRKYSTTTSLTVVSSVS